VELESADYLGFRATINLPLHGGHAPPYLIERMVKLSRAISKVLIDQYGEHEFLRRLSDPLWFQAFGCVLGFDWHSSGVTTVVTGVLKQALSVDTHGICITGGKGRKSRDPRSEIPMLAEKYYNLSSTKVEGLLYASKMAARVDGSAVQDGYSLYHHVILFDKEGDWTVVQQGLNPDNMMARRYHWISDTVKSFVSEPHAGIICDYKNSDTLNMTSPYSEESQKVSLELATGNTENLKSSLLKVTKNNSGDRPVTLERWMGESGKSIFKSDSHIDHYEMPRRLNWNLFRKVYDIQPTNYEQLISIPGFGPAAVRALSLVGEIIFGTKASWEDPVKFNFAHGGKDGVPYPVARKTYDKSISFLTAAIEGAEIQRQERITALKKLANFSTRLFPQPFIN
jgi:uncharacterized protein